MLADVVINIWFWQSDAVALFADRISPPAVKYNTYYIIDVYGICVLYLCARRPQQRAVVYICLVIFYLWLLQIYVDPMPIANHANCPRALPNEHDVFYSVFATNENRKYKRA